MHPKYDVIRFMFHWNAAACAYHFYVRDYILFALGILASLVCYLK